MAGFLETLVRYVEVFDSDPFADAAARVRADADRRADAEDVARDIERAGGILFGKKGDR